MGGPIARVHVDDYEPEVYTGDDALIVANRMAEVFRADFPGAVVGVSYNPAAAEARKRTILANFGLEPQPTDQEDQS